MRNNHQNSLLYDPQIIRGLMCGVEKIAITGNITLQDDSATIQSLDPDAGRTVTLPSPKRGLIFFFLHGSTNAADLTISSPVDRAGAAGATTMGTISQNQIGVAISDGVTWFVGMMPQT